MYKSRDAVSVDGEQNDLRCIGCVAKYIMRKSKADP
jgi:hypothetical protein